MLVYLHYLSIFRKKSKIMFISSLLVAWYNLRCPVTILPCALLIYKKKLRKHAYMCTHKYMWYTQTHKYIYLTLLMIQNPQNKIVLSSLESCVCVCSCSSKNLSSQMKKTYVCMLLWWFVFYDEHQTFTFYNLSFIRIIILYILG